MDSVDGQKMLIQMYRTVKTTDKAAATSGLYVFLPISIHYKSKLFPFLVKKS